MNREARYWALTMLGGAAFMATIWCMFNNSPGFIWSGLCTMGLLGAREWDKMQGLKEQRTATMQDEAERMGFSFRETAPLNVLGWSEAFALTRDDLKLTKTLGESFGSLLRPRATNVMEKTVGDTTIAVFDYAPVSDSDSRPRYVVFGARSPRLQHGYSAISTATGWQRISDGFRSEQSVHDGFHHGGAANALPRVTDLLDDETSLECGDGCLLVYRAAADPRQVDPEEILRIGSEILAEFNEANVLAAV